LSAQNETPIEEYDRLVRNLSRDLLTVSEHHHTAVQMLAYHDMTDLASHICNSIPETIRLGFREFLIEIQRNDYCYSVRRCFEDRRPDAEMCNDATSDQKTLRRIIPPLLELL
jgi:hypothetical protein